MASSAAETTISFTSENAPPYQQPAPMMQQMQQQVTFAMPGSSSQPQQMVPVYVPASSLAFNQQQQQQQFQQKQHGYNAFPPQHEQIPVMMPAPAYGSVPNQVYYTQNAAGQMVPVMISQSQNFQANESQFQYQRTSPGTSMKAMRTIQLIFSIFLIIFVSLMAGLGSACDWNNNGGSSNYYVCGNGLMDLWAILLPIATTVATIVQICSANPVDPGCQGSGSCCRSASDLVFAILYTMQTALLASIAWMLMYMPYSWAVSFTAMLICANLTSSLLTAVYWVTYANILQCASGCSCITNF